MIGRLPTSLTIDGVEHPIRTDYRDILLIFEAFAEPNTEDFNEKHKMYFMLNALYKDFKSIDNIEEAIKQAMWFLNIGNTVSSEEVKSQAPVYDWNKDEQFIFSAINKVANKEVREVDYMHFWTFIGLFMEVGEGSFSYIVGIRSKLNKGIKLTKGEEKYYKKNKERIELKRQKTSQELEDIALINKLLN